MAIRRAALLRLDIARDRRVVFAIVEQHLHALKAVLEPLEQTLITASSGTQALRQVLEHDFAVILLDVQMPDMSGIETAAMIRERERSKTTPIIFLTGVVKTAEMMFKGYSAGAVDYLMKPVISGVLRAKVEVFVELAQVRHSLQQEIAERARIGGELAKLNMVLELRNEDLTAAIHDTGVPDVASWTARRAGARRTGGGAGLYCPCEIGKLRAGSESP